MNDSLYFFQKIKFQDGEIYKLKSDDKTRTNHAICLSYSGN